MLGKLGFLTLGLLALGAAGCSTQPLARTPAIDRVELVKSAAFDHGCPAADIKVLAVAEEFSAPSEYVLDVCGERHVYKRVGMMYFDAR
jgi:hypothetical protein